MVVVVAGAVVGVTEGLVVVVDVDVDAGGVIVGEVVVVELASSGSGVDDSGDDVVEEATAITRVTLADRSGDGVSDT